MIPFSPTDRLETAKHELAHRKVKKQLPLGLLIVEQFTNSSNFDAQLANLQAITPHLAIALNNAVEFESVFLMRFWRWIGSKIRWLLGYPKWAIATVVVAISAILSLLAFLPSTYRVHADGNAMPEIQHEIYAEIDGVVKEVLVAGNQKVRKGQTLLLLSNTELQLETLTTKNRIEELTSQLHSLGVKLDSARLKADREQELNSEGERATAIVELEGAKRKLAILEERLKRLTVVSNFDGVIATFQPNQLLRGRPVRQGDLMLEVMEDEGPWRLELRIPEHRMGHVIESLNQNHQLSVGFVAMTDVYSTKSATLTEIATRTDHNETDGAYVRAYAKIDKDSIPNQRIGAEVSAKIRCPDYSLFYCLFGDVVEFVSKYLWW